MAGLTTYHYDATERLVKVDYQTGSEEYRYDKAGNRTEKLINGFEAEHYQYDARNRLISQDVISLRSDGTNTPEHKEYTYDEQGNMLSDGRRSFTYDAMNRLSQVRTTEGNIQKNRYDGEGLRAEMEENGRLVSFLFDGQKVVAETDCDQNAIRYIRGYELISSDSEKAKTYYHYASDEMGSITHITDEAGNVCNHYEYDAFGDFTVKEETIENRFGFTSEQYDPIAGLYYLRARFYNPVIGRFIQEDTYYGDGLNLYSYCQNNPVKYIDPSGFAKLPCLEKEAAINELKKAGVPVEELESEYQKVRDNFKTAEEALMSIKAKNLSGSGKNTINYGQFDALGRPTGIEAIITKDMLGTGSPANHNIYPPGFMGGENVYYRVVPIYEGNNLMPKAVAMEAIGSNGFRYAILIENEKNAAIPTKNLR